MAQRPIAVVAYGVVGAGKSFLCNVLANKQVFVSGANATSVTTITKSVDVPAEANVHDFVGRVYDPPGLEDPDVKAVEQNRKELIAAIKQDETQVFMIVLSPQNGRAANADIEAYQDMVRCFAVSAESIVVVVNRVPNHAPATYPEDLKNVLTGQGVSGQSWVFVNNIPDGDITHTTANASRIQLWQAIAGLRANHHQKQKDREGAELELKQKALQAQKEKQEADNKIQLASIQVPPPRPQIVHHHVHHGRCFSSRMRVLRVKPSIQTDHESHAEWVSISTVHEGDMLAAVNAAGQRVWSPVYFHLGSNESQAMLRITFAVPQTAEQSYLEVTDEHVLYTVDAKHADPNSGCVSSDCKVLSRPVTAATVTPNCLLLVWNHAKGQPSIGRVVDVQRICGSGLYAPMTRADTLIVENVVASCFEINVTYGWIDSLLVRGLSHVAPRLIASDMFKRVAKFYDHTTSAIAKAVRDRVWSTVK